MSSIRPPVSENEPPRRGVSIATRSVWASASARGFASGAARVGAEVPLAPGVAGCAVSVAVGTGAGRSWGGNRRNQTRMTAKLSAVARIRFLPVS